MASSVSSERAFSSAGITISKRRNRLDGDIVEALQCLKTLIHQDLMSRDVTTIAEEEARLDCADEQRGNADYTTSEIVDADDVDMLLSDGEGDANMDDDVEIVVLTGSQS
jgi:hypothetical protein